MGTYLKYARHRVSSPKPPSERQFDRPRQKLADARFGSVLKKGRCPFRRLALPISPIPKTIKDSAIFSESFAFFFNSTRKTSEARFAVILNQLSQNKFKNTARGVAALSRRVAYERGLNCVAPFGISASRNRQSPPNCPTVSGFGYVQTAALGLGRDGVRTEWAILAFRGDRRNLRSKSP